MLTVVDRPVLLWTLAEPTVLRIGFLAGVVFFLATVVFFLTVAFFLTVVFFGGTFSAAGGAGIGTRGLALLTDATRSMAKTVTKEDVTATSTTWEDVTS